MKIYQLENRAFDLDKLVFIEIYDDSSKEEPYFIIHLYFDNSEHKIGFITEQKAKERYDDIVRAWTSINFPSIFM